MEPRQYYIGVDVGGTNLVAGVVDGENHILGKAKVRASEYPTAEGMIHAIVEICRQATAKAGLTEGQISHVGVGIPGVVNRRTAFVYQTVNAPFHMVEFGRLFRQEWDVPVYLENDANCAAIAEFLAGAGRGRDSALMVTLGTGVGGGFINYGRLEGGINLMGMEIGHMVLRIDGHPCPCGRRGCWEQYSSATGLKRQTREAIARNPNSLLARLAEEDGKVGGQLPFRAARQGCPVGQEVVERYLHYLAEGLTNLVNVFQPEVIVLGGGVSNERDEDFLIPLRTQLGGFRFNQDGMVQTEIIKAELGNDAGIIGAGLLHRVYLLNA